MSNPSSDNLKIAQTFYEYVNNDPNALPSVLHPEISWEIIPGFPYGGKYEGLQSVFENFFGSVMQHFEFWNAVPDEFIDAGDRIIVLGNYKTKAKESGMDVTLGFTHVWTLKDGMLARLQQNADTVQVSRALNNNVPGLD